MEHGKIYVPCEFCGHMNTLRQITIAPQAVTYEEEFMAQIQKIIEDSDAEGERSRVVAYRVARQILYLFCDWDQAPPYRIQVYDAEAWRTLKTIALHSL